MGRKKAITKKSEIANFRIMPEEKELLDSHARQHGMNLSGFIRMLIKKYINESQEETRLLNQLKESDAVFKPVVEALELTSDKPGLGPHSRALKAFLKFNQGIFENWPPDDPGKINPDIYEKTNALRKDIIRRYLVYHAYVFDRAKEEKKRREMEDATLVKQAEFQEVLKKEMEEIDK